MICHLGCSASLSWPLGGEKVCPTVNTMNAIGLLLCLAGGFFVAGNLACLVFRRSLVPPLGGVLLAAGLLCFVEWRRYWWIGLAVDAGFWMMVLSVPILWSEFRRSRPALLHLNLAGSNDKIDADVRLFLPDHYEIKIANSSPSDVEGASSRGSLGTWRSFDSEIELTSHADKPEARIKMKIRMNVNGKGYEVVESTIWESDRFNLPEFPPIGFQLEAK